MPHLGTKKNVALLFYPINGLATGALEDFCSHVNERSKIHIKQTLEDLQTEQTVQEA
jgi:hypothetical protein